MAIKAAQLQADLYEVLDRVLATGEPVEIERGGRLLRIEPVERAHADAVPEANAKPSVWDRLVPDPGLIIGDPDDLVHIDWSKEWKP